MPRKQGTSAVHDGSLAMSTLRRSTKPIFFLGTPPQKAPGSHWCTTITRDAPIQTGQCIDGAWISTGRHPFGGLHWALSRPTYDRPRRTCGQPWLVNALVLYGMWTLTTYLSPLRTAHDLRLGAGACSLMGLHARQIRLTQRPRRRTASVHGSRVGKHVAMYAAARGAYERNASGPRL